MKNLLYLIPALILILALALAAFPATGTVTIEEHVLNPQKRIVFNWISDATGEAVSSFTTNAFSGKIHSLITTPSVGDASPSVGYDVYLYNRYGMDVLQGRGENRSATATEVLQSPTTAYNADFIPLAGDRLYLSIQNSGAVRSGTAMLYIEP